MARHRLPVEILEDVVGFVGSGSQNKYWTRTAALLSCCLVCRDWVPNSRVHLYRDVVLDNKRKATSFMNTITTSPRFGEYVRRLGIYPKKTHGDWIYKIHRILPSLLPNVFYLEYRGLPVVHRLFFVCSLQFTSITTLTLVSLHSQTFREIVQLINGFPNLKLLSIIECKWQLPISFYCRDPAQQKCTRSNPISFRLQWLSSSTPVSNDGDDMIHWLTKQQRANSLNELSLQYDHMSIQSPHFNALLHQCSSTLESLKLSLGNASYAGSYHIPGDLPVETTCQYWLVSSLRLLMHDYRVSCYRIMSQPPAIRDGVVIT